MDHLQLVRSRLGRTQQKDLQRIADEAQVPFATLVKIKYGTTKSPRFTTVQKLADYFIRQAA